MEYVLLFSILGGPVIVSFIAACILGVKFAVRFYKSSGKRGLAMLFGASAFLLLFFLINKLAVVGLNLVVPSSPVWGVLAYVFGIYFFIAGWVLRAAGVLVAVIAVYRVPQESVSATPAAPWLVRLAPLVILGAVAVLAYPLYSIYRAQQLSVEWDARMHDVGIRADTATTMGAINIQKALEEYHAVHGEYPSNLEALVPTFFDEVSLGARARGYTYTAGAEYTLCANYEAGTYVEKCFTRESPAILLRATDPRDRSLEADEVTTAELQMIRLALNKFFKANNTYPVELSELLPEYLRAVPTGPYGRGYEYIAATGNYELCANYELATRSREAGRQCVNAQKGFWE